MTETQANYICSRLPGEDLAENHLQKRASDVSPSVRVSIAILHLDGGFVAELHLRKDICYVIFLVVVDPETIRLSLAVTGAERRLLMDSRDNGFPSVSAVLSGKSACLKSDTVPVKKRIELVKRSL